MFAALIFVIGVASAGAIARLSKSARREALTWLRATETMVRKLLLVEAQTPPPPARAKQPLPSRNLPRRKSSPAFVLAPHGEGEPHAAPRIRALGGPMLVRDVWAEQRRQERLAALKSASKSEPHQRFANRVLALKRVLAQPLRHVRRLARLLARGARRLVGAIAFKRLRERPMLMENPPFERADAETRTIARRINSS